MKKIGWKIRYFPTHDLHRFSPQPCYTKIPVLICRVFFFCHHWWNQRWQLDRCGTVCIYCLSGDFPERIMFYKGLMAWTLWLNETAKFLEQQGCLSQQSCCWLALVTSVPFGSSLWMPSFLYTLKKIPTTELHFSSNYHHHFHLQESRGGKRWGEISSSYITVFSITEGIQGRNLDAGTKAEAMEGAQLMG